MTLISDTTALDAFCKRLRAANYVTVDTEFMREKTYWPILCLLQIAGPDEAAAIDALAPDIDLGPVYELFDDRSVTKVFHAARQDLEIFFHQNGRLPEPVFDTQVAAMVCGFGDAVGYEQLIAKLTKQRVDKSSRFTDWSVRPLSERQIAYALADVTHLRPAYEKLARKLDAQGRAAWIDEEMAVLAASETYDGDPDNAYRRIKARSKSGRFLAVLRELAAWREREAQRRDQPRNRVLRDEALVEIAHHTPKSIKELSRTRGLSAKTAEGGYGAQILEAVERGLAVPEAECPQPESKPDLPHGLGPVTDLLKVLLKMKSEESHVATKLLASSADIDQIAAFGEQADVRAMSGWRREVFGNDALELRAGQLALAVDGNRMVLLPADGGGGAES